MRRVVGVFRDDLADDDDVYDFGRLDAALKHPLDRMTAEDHLVTLQRRYSFSARAND